MSAARPGAEPLIAHANPDAVLAWRAGTPIKVRGFVAAVRSLAPRIEGPRHVVNACVDRYDFAVTFCAALLNGQTNLLPPSRVPVALAELAARYPDHVFVSNEDADGPFAATWRIGSAEPAHEPSATGWPHDVDRAHEAAIAFTSGSTGVPQPQTKLWGSLVDSAREETQALSLGGESMRDVVLVGTVSPQHMYGLESTVLLALHGGFAFGAEQPLHPPQIAQALGAVRGRRVLVTTPVHLRALLRAEQSLPPLHAVVSATAPLALDLAAECEQRWHTQVLEIYGCTEAGQVASRRTVAGRAWRTLPGVRIEARDDGGESSFWASGGHIVCPAPLADLLNLIDETTFTLEARTADLVNIAGKRTSLAALNHALLSIEGVLDGAFVFPEAPDTALALPLAAREARLAALVVAPSRSRADLLAELRRRIDPVFLPRPLLQVEALPRNAQGKLPRAEVLALLARAPDGP